MSPDCLRNTRSTGLHDFDWTGQGLRVTQKPRVNQPFVVRALTGAVGSEVYAGWWGTPRRLRGLVYVRLLSEYLQHDIYSLSECQ